MKNRYLWAGALALAIGAISQMETKAQWTNLNGTVITNGAILVTTRAANDGWFFQQSSSTVDDMDDNRGSGTSPGDVAMCELLEDNGYTTRLLPDKALSSFKFPFTSGALCQNVYGAANDPSVYFTGNPGPANGQGPFNELLSAMLIVVSGSGSSSDVIMPNTYGVPIVCGESAILGCGTNGVPTGSHGEIFLYNGVKTTGNVTTLGGDYQYMKVLDPNHPIMKGIPLVSLPAFGTNSADTNLTYVKFIRDPYPNENAHVLKPLVDPNVPGGVGLPNYQVSTTFANISAGNCVPAPGLEILGVLAANTNYSIFAVMDKGGTLGDTSGDASSPWFGKTQAPARMVHFFVNEQGSANARRSFNALSVWGRILFVRACQWAMEQDPAPYQGLGIIDVGVVSPPSTIRLGWTGSKDYNYRIYGTTSLVNPNWLPVVDSITNNGDGVRVTRTLNIASAANPTFLRVAPLPFLNDL
jgi:hypothetical protein